MNNSNNIEVEAKILNVSHKDIEEDILKLGGKKIFDGELDAVWMQDPDIEERKVRVRKEGDKVMTEYKEKIDNEGGFKESIEIGYSPDHHDNQIKVFEKLGLEQANRSIKNRVSYLLENDKELGTVQFDFDKYSDLDGMEIPELMEIEASSGDIIIKVAKVLGFKEEDLKNWNARELAEYYKNI